MQPLEAPPETAGAAGSTGATSAPATATAALEKASSALESSPSGDSTGTAASIAGTTGDAKSTPAATASTPGEAPESRIQAAVANARRELTERLGWAEDLNREEVQDAIEMLRDLSRDPKAFMQQIAAELGGDEPESDPDPDLVSQDGKIRTYSEAAHRKIMANLEKRLTSRFSKEFRPAVEFTNEYRNRDAVQARIRQAQEIGRNALTEARKLPHFTENEEHISTKLASMDPNYRRQVGSIAALHMAYNAVLAEKVLPTLRQNTEKEVLAGFKKSANASAGGIDPGSGTGGKPPIKDGDVNALARRMEELANA